MLKFFQWTFLIALLIPTFPLFGKSGLEQAGDVGQYAVPIAALALSIVEHDQQGVSQLVTSTIATLGTVYAVKPIAQSKRPKNDKHDSFPSGHTALAFSGATYLHRRYGLCYGIPAYLTASFVGYTRTQSESHRTIDILAGAAIAITANYFFTTPYKKWVQVTPIVSKDCIAISADCSF